MTDQSMSKKQKLDARESHKYFDVLCDDVVVFLLLFLRIDELFGIRRVTKSGVFSRGLGKALVLFPDMKLGNDDPPARIQAVVKHCLKPRIFFSNLDDLDVSVKMVSIACHTISDLDISLTCMSSVLAAGVTLRGLKKLELRIDEEDEILFRATDFPNLTLLALVLPEGDVHKSVITFIRSELQKFRLLKSLIILRITSRAVADMLEPPPNIKDLSIHFSIPGDFDITRLSGKFARLESLSMRISNRTKTVGLGSFLNGIPPLKTIIDVPGASSNVVHMLNRSRDTVMKWRAEKRDMEILGGQDIVFPQLTEVSLLHPAHLDMKSSKILARVAPNLTSLAVFYFVDESLVYLHKHGINLKSLTIYGWNSERKLEVLADATVFPGLMSLRIDKTNVALRQHLRNIRKDCVVY